MTVEVSMILCNWWWMGGLTSAGWRGKRRKRKAQATSPVLHRKQGSQVSVGGKGLLDFQQGFPAHQQGPAEGKHVPIV